MTQALAVHEILSSSGHELVGVVAGRNSQRSLPEFFARGFPVPVQCLPSPGFVFQHSRSVNVPGTVWQTARNLGRYRRSLIELRSIIRETRPDVIVNFFEPLAGLLQWSGPGSVPVLAVGHQYMIWHPGYVRLAGHVSQQAGMHAFVRLVGHRATRLALSLYEDSDLPERQLIVCPPILRRQLFELQPADGAYHLVYLLNHGYAEEIDRWQRSRPEVEMHVFYDKPGASAEETVRPNLTFHRLNGEKFLRLMAGCRAVVCTAGFESVSEAAWLGKPLFMVPVENHVEQMLNALDAVKLGLGITDRRFELSRLAELPPRIDVRTFRNWVARAGSILSRAINEAVGRPAGAQKETMPASLAA
jgi:uncharacterized protein (TIGR00661 family)